MQRELHGKNPQIFTDRVYSAAIYEAGDLILKTSSLVEHSQQHEANDLILKTSSHVEQSQQEEEFLSQALSGSSDSYSQQTGQGKLCLAS